MRQLARRRQLAMQPTLFISDLHLAPGHDAATAAFHAFARGPARRAAAVYILGDLFDAWIGDDQTRDPYYRAVADSLRAVSAEGIPLFFAHGNRDFLIGEAFLREIGARLLAEQTVIDLNGRRALISHGDELCTDDVAYQRFKARTRTDEWQRNILRNPYIVRRGIALYFRIGSLTATRFKRTEMMDVNEDTVGAAFRKFGVDLMIHGHTHRPARHHYTIDGTARERVVLSDWVNEGHYLEAGPRRLEARDITG